MEHSTEFAGRSKRRAAVVRGLKDCCLITAVVVLHAACGGGVSDATNRDPLSTADAGPNSSASPDSVGSDAGASRLDPRTGNFFEYPQVDRCLPASDTPQHPTKA